ncbi:MAG: hypothetical protein IJF83_10825 [Methanobrevibacter sp.]|nr:hypothetical protein [Methanobrevibacter sp.]
MVNEYLKELWFVDYCNNCKDLDIMSPNEVPCHHPWYCWHDGSEVQELEAELGKLYEKEHWNGRLNASERELLFKLKQKKFELVKKKLGEYRKCNR